MIAIIAITQAGKKIAGILNTNFAAECRLFFPAKGSLKKLIGDIFGQRTDKDKFDAVVFIMALGIVARIIAPYLKNKHSDPAVVAVDEGKRFAISVACGHEGGANKLSVEIGNILNAEPIITTASQAKKKIIIGVGCRRGIEKEEIVKGIKYALTKAKTCLNSVKYIATIDFKKNEFGLKKACLDLGIPLRIIPLDMVKEFKGCYQRSSFVKEKIGIEGVSEPCALLAGRRTKLILPKIKLDRVTVAVARED